MIAKFNPLTLWDLIQAAPGGDPAIILPETDVTISYKDLRDQVAGMADALASLEIQPGDRVHATYLPNGLPAIVSLLAACIAGTAAPLNPGYREDEVAFYLDDTGAKILLCPPEGAEAARKAAEGRGVRVYSVETDATGRVGIAGVRADRKAALPSHDAVALVLHTSGSTGRPKRIPITHRNISASAQNIAAHYALSAQDVSLCVMPLFHVHGLVASVLSTFLSGGTVVLPREFDPLAFWRTADARKVTWYTAVPTIHNHLLARASEERLAGAAGLRFIRSCSSPLPPEMMARMERAFGVPVLEAYGMTEACHQMASNPHPPAARKPGSVGLGTGVEIGIMDDAGNLLATGVPGEVVIQGPNVVSGYENNAEANASAFHKGWFRTGDQGFLDADGYLTLTGRLKEQINRGGEKIAPREIDEVLLRHPAVAEAICFGIPDEKLGEEVGVAVVLRKGQAASEAELRQFAATSLARFKVPRRVVFVQEIPKGATGKAQRLGLAAKLGLTDAESGSGVDCPSLRRAPRPKNV